MHLYYFVQIATDVHKLSFHNFCIKKGEELMNKRDQGKCEIKAMHERD